MSKAFFKTCIFSTVLIFCNFAWAEVSDCAKATAQYKRLKEWDKALGSVSLGEQLVKAKKRVSEACKKPEKQQVVHAPGKVLKPSGKRLQKVVGVKSLSPKKSFKKSKPKSKPVLKKDSRVLTVSLYWAFFGLLLAVPIFFLVFRRKEFEPGSYDHHRAIEIKGHIEHEDHVKKLEDKIEHLAEVIQIEKVQRQEQERLFKEKIREKDEEDWDALASELLDEDLEDIMIIDEALSDAGIEIDIDIELDIPPVPTEYKDNVLKFPSEPLSNS
jgi:hypothetical protein